VPTVKKHRWWARRYRAFARPTDCELICFARKRNFVQRPAANWHDGQITLNLSSPSRKNIPLLLSRKSSA
jgi:hypothetical protein